MIRTPSGGPRPRPRHIPRRAAEVSSRPVDPRPSMSAATPYTRGPSESLSKRPFRIIRVFLYITVYIDGEARTVPLQAAAEKLGAPLQAGPPVQSTRCCR